MWEFDEENNQWVFDGYTDYFFYLKRVFVYPPETHEVKLNLSITEAAICTRQRVNRDEFYEWKRSLKNK